MTPLEVAQTQLGVEEVPRGSNWGPQVKDYLLSVGIDFAANWCMAFVYWCVKKSEYKNTLVKTGGVLKQFRKIDPRYIVPLNEEPRPGDIFIMDFGNGLGHTGIVESVEDHMIHTIEGNTNDENSRNGYEVCRRYRFKDKINGYIRLNQ